jgi:uncharacterized membrane protein
MMLLVLGLVLFLGIHSLAIVSPSARDRFAAKLGEWPFKGVYSVVAIVGFVLIVHGYADARLDPTVLYVPPSWTTHLSMLLMLPVFIALLAAYLPGRISATLKHPMLVAVKAWAVAHLIANGTLADVLLFGSFLGWAVIDRISLKRRTEGPKPRAPASPVNDAIAVVGGLAIYLAFVFWLHAWLIGVSLTT